MDSKQLDPETLVKFMKSEPTNRFLIELEFVELLANPHYLHHLAQKRYFEDKNFLNYIDYLQYWRSPEYVLHLSHVQCLHFLELLQRPEFREKLLDINYINMIHNNQFWHWRHYRANRYFEKQAREEQALETKQVEESNSLAASPLPSTF
eukprot:TRINITY_DN13421_c0_g1_i1.p1 TRINITY_DN13421_c0_g1~~TRINITY_DN13421_c0_g1_i1.p1  ORF type:complete len:165 (-),score=10.26 TRINITY_DN13421_c0_g1_i1:60-509(-)